MKVQEARGAITAAPLIRRFFLAEREILGVDLFGDPVLPRKEGRGRPQTVWDRATSNRALVAFARGLSVAKAAKVCGLSTPTFRKVYFSECAKRRDAELRLEMTVLAKLAEKAADGDTGASREMFKQLDRLRLRDQHQADAPAPKVKAKPLGKKEAAEMSAREPTGLYDPPAAPTQH